MEERLKFRSQERQLNVRDNIKYPDDAYFAKLDSSIKKNSAFVKKLRNLTESQRESILKELSCINLKKYISEVASSIVDAKIKMSDVNLALKVSSQLNRLYPDFAPQLMEIWSKQLPKKPSDLASVNASKLRTDLRLIGELVIIGVFTLREGLPLLGQLLTLLTKYDRENHVHLSTLVSFCKNCGDEYLGLVPGRIVKLCNKYPDLHVPRSNFLTPENQKSVNNLFKEYHKSLVSHVIREHESLRKLAQSNQNLLISRGELTNERKEQFESAAACFSKLHTSAQQFADLMNEEFPELGPINAQLQLMDGIIDTDISNGCTGDSSRGAGEFDSSSMWEDEETRSFYTNLPDLKSLVPSILYKESAKDGLKSETDETKVKDVTDGELDEMLLVTDISNPAELLFIDETDEPDTSLTGSKEDLAVTSTVSKNNNNTTINTRASNKAMMDAFITSLSQCVNQDMIDKAATNFVTNLNTKKNRNKLVRTVFSVPRIRLDLLPLYSRLVKTLYPLMPHIANDLITLLRQDFMYHVKKKDQINIESKIKTVRFIGELVKFDLFSKGDAINCLRLLLHDFAHHSIEMAAALLETCGRYLLRSSSTHHRMASLLDLMMRKKALLSFDSRYISIIENAYYAANPVVESISSQQKKDRPPHHLYARYLIYDVLDKKKVHYVLRQLRKFDWNDAETSCYLIKCLSCVWNINFLNIKYAALLLAGLKEYQEQAVYKVIDATLEEVCVMLEINRPLFNQRRISVIKFVGELYNYKLIDSYVVFEQLYLLITFGTDYSQYSPPYKHNHTIECDLDPPEHLFRIRLVCQLLESCASYFTSSMDRKKLDYYLLFFQKYYWLKKSHPFFSCINNHVDCKDESNSKVHTASALTGSSGFPITIDILFIDTVKKVRPKFTLANSLNEANTAVESALTSLKPQVMKICPQLTGQSKSNHVNDSNNSSNNNSNAGLNAILEEERNNHDDENESDQENDIIGENTNETIVDLEGDCTTDDAEKKQETSRIGDSYSDDEVDGDSEEDDDDEEEDEEDEEEFDEEPAPDEESASSGDLSDILSNSDRTTPTASPPGPKYVPCPEDDEFLKEFDRLMTESINSRANVRSNVTDLTVPNDRVIIKSKHNDKVNPSGEKKSSTSNTDATTSSTATQSGTLSLLVMTRGTTGKNSQSRSRGPAKPILRPIEVPLDSDFAVSIMQQEERERKEKLELKQLTLNMSERMDEAYSGGN